MNPGYFEYTCTYWDEFSENKNKFKTVHGVVFADSWSDAMFHLEHYYDHIENILIQGLEPNHIYEFESDPVKFKIILEEKNDAIDPS